MLGTITDGRIVGYEAEHPRQGVRLSPSFHPGKDHTNAGHACESAREGARDDPCPSSWADNVCVLAGAPLPGRERAQSHTQAFSSSGRRRRSYVLDGRSLYRLLDGRTFCRLIDGRSTQNCSTVGLLLVLYGRILPLKQAS